MEEQFEILLNTKYGKEMKSSMIALFQNHQTRLAELAYKIMFGFNDSKMEENPNIKLLMNLKLFLKEGVVIDGRL